jgi:hypothetical protein
MMIKYQVECGEEESALSEVDNNIDVNSNTIDVDEVYVGYNNVELMLHYNLEKEYYRGMADNVAGAL